MRKVNLEKALLRGEEGSRDQDAGERKRRATKVWLDREFADYDPDVELGRGT